MFSGTDSPCTLLADAVQVQVWFQGKFMAVRF